jgi:hypothetical protein
LEGLAIDKGIAHRQNFLSFSVELKSNHTDEIPEGIRKKEEWEHLEQ